MKVDIILSKRGRGYLAQVSNLPEIRAKQPTREADSRGRLACVGSGGG